MNHENIWNARIFQDKASAQVCRPHEVCPHVLVLQRAGAVAAPARHVLNTSKADIHDGGTTCALGGTAFSCARTLDMT